MIERRSDISTTSGFPGFMMLESSVSHNRRYMGIDIQA